MRTLLGSSPEFRSKSDEYVEFISGYLDRTAPSILYDKKFIVFNNGEEDYSEIGCIDEYSTCELSYEKKDNVYVRITAVDEAGNKLSNESVTYSVNGEDTEVKTDSNGEVSFTRYNCL